MPTMEEIREYQKAVEEFRATPVGAAFIRFKHALSAAWIMDTEDSFNDTDRADTKRVREEATKAERELLKLLNAP